MEITKKEYQETIDEYNAEIKALQSKKKTWVKHAESKGYDLIRGKFIESKEVYGVFYNIDYYSHFDGHTSDAVYREQSGVDEISKEEFTSLKSNIGKYLETKDKKICKEIIEILSLYADENFYDMDEYVKFFTIKDDLIYWEYKGSDDQGEICSGSWVEIKSTTEKKIKSTKRVNKEYKD